MIDGPADPAGNRVVGQARSIGVVGVGNMGSALVKGWLRPSQAAVRVFVWDKAEAAVQRLVESHGVEPVRSLDELARVADVVTVVVKPKDAGEVLGAVAGSLRADQTVISAMAGLTLEWMRGVLGPGPALYRIMPNLGVGLGVGAVAVAHEAGAPDEQVQEVVELLRPLGLVEVLPEEVFDVVTGVSGSGPAFLALAIESLEDGAVAAGLSRPLARRLVRQTALATAEILEQCGNSAEKLKVALTEEGELPQGGMLALEQRGVRAAFQEAVEAAVARSRRLG